MIKKFNELNENKFSSEEIYVIADLDNVNYCTHDKNKLDEMVKYYLTDMGIEFENLNSPKIDIGGYYVKYNIISDKNQIYDKSETTTRFLYIDVLTSFEKLIKTKKANDFNL